MNVSAWVPATALPLALCIDHLWDESRAAWHPVVWMGRALGACGARIAPVVSRPEDSRLFGLERFAGARWQLLF